MKHTLYLLVLAVALLTACSKTKKSRTIYGGCIKTLAVDAPMNYSLTTEDSLYGMDLMKRWWPHYDKVRLIHVTRMSGVGGNSADLLVQQYIEGLPLLSDYISIYFFNDSLKRVYGVIKSTTLDNVRTLPLDSAKAIFFAQIAKEPDFIRQQATTYSCLTAIPGYYDLNLGTGNDTVKIVKAWKVYPAEWFAPEAIIDDNGHLISFFNGLYH